MSNTKPSILHLALWTICLASCAAPATIAPVTTPFPTSQPQSITAVSPHPTVSPTQDTTSAALLRYPVRDLIHDLAWSPDGSRLAVAAGTNIHLYETGDLTEQHSLAVGLWAERIAFHPTLPLLAAAARDGSLRFWDLASGDERCRFSAHAKGANSLAFAPQGTLLATTGTDIISHLWDITSLQTGGCDVRATADLIGSSFTSPDIAFSADGQQFALVDRHDIYLRATQTRKLIAVLKSDLAVFDIALSPDGRWLAAAQDKTNLALWDLATAGGPTPTILPFPGDAPQTYVWRVDFSSDSRLLAAGSSAGSLQVWDLESLKPLLNRHLPDAVSALAFRPGTHRLAIGILDGALYLWELDTP